MVPGESCCITAATNLVSNIAEPLLLQEAADVCGKGDFITSDKQTKPAKTRAVLRNRPFLFIHFSSSS